MADRTLPNENTRAFAAEDARQKADADEAPTPEEEAAAERAGEPNEEVAENYEEMIERGANQKGEGRLP
jgi:ribosome-binding protein aMBF1 (putative translation factor)